MIKTLAEADFGKRILVVPPATLVEYVYRVIQQADSLKKYLQDFDYLKSTRGTDEFEQRVQPAYLKARRHIREGRWCQGHS